MMYAIMGELTLIEMLAIFRHKIALEHELSSLGKFGCDPQPHNALI